MVTIARLVPMPILCWMIYEGKIWPALVLGTVIGSTDFIDGYLARKHGPTVMGGLLDPIADKVFIAFAYLPFADLGVVPSWAVALMFVREFLVTGLRSAYEQRGLTMKTSYFGKVKTWTQMQGLGMMLLFLLLWDNRPVMYGLIIAFIVAPLIAMTLLWLVKRRFWTGALIMSALSAPLLFLYMYGSVGRVVEVLMIVVVALTWMSGIDYVMLGLRQLRGRGDFRGSDAIRLLSAVVLPVLIFAALVQTAMPAWPLATILAVEVAVGGLDNLLSHHKAHASALTWSLRVLGCSAVLGAALALDAGGHERPLLWLGILATIISVGGVAWEFIRGRDYYVDRRMREKALRESLSSESA